MLIFQLIRLVLRDKPDHVIVLPGFFVHVYRLVRFIDC